MRSLEEYRGKQALFFKQSTEALKSLQLVAKIESSESSNRLEGIELPHRKIEELVLKDTAPKSRSERNLRMSKVKQKVSECFRKESYAKAYCRISSYLQTMANKGHHPLTAIQMALAGEITV